MGTGHLEREPIKRDRHLDTAGELRTLPLLPYEKQLIDLLGCSEEEYQFFVSEARKKGAARPAGYEHLPEVSNGFVVPILINLAIGIALSAVSYLLAPKPNTDKPNEIKQRRLRDQRGRSRFNETYGFDGMQELAAYGDLLAVIFGDYVENGTDVSGGNMVQPQLVWSRTISYGTHQALRLMFVVGETLGWGGKKPGIAGVYIGNNGLDAIDRSRYAFYYRPGTEQNGNLSGRIYDHNILYGTRGSNSAGDPNQFSDVFLCPTRFGPDQPGFSHTYVPSNGTAFGVFNPVKNGTGCRLNWRVISCPKSSQDKSRVRGERTMVAGPRADGKDQGMPGVGAGYAPCMGLITHNGSTYKTPTEVAAAVGDTVVFRISKRRHSGAELEIDGISGLNGEAVNDMLVSQREAADDALQVGERFLIGNCVFVVRNRSDRWRDSNTTMDNK